MLIVQKHLRRNPNTFKHLQVISSNLYAQRVAVAYNLVQTSSQIGKVRVKKPNNRRAKTRIYTMSISEATIKLDKDPRL